MWWQPGASVGRMRIGRSTHASKNGLSTVYRELHSANKNNNEQSQALPLGVAWLRCADQLKQELPNELYGTWIQPLQVEECDRQGRPHLRLLAPNRFVLDWVSDKYLARIEELVRHHCQIAGLGVCLEIGSSTPRERDETPVSGGVADVAPGSQPKTAPAVRAAPAAPTQRINGGAHPAIEGGVRHESYINPEFRFDNFIEGTSNQMARAAALQVAENPGGGYNPLFLYGGVGLGKTHLMHAVGNALQMHNPSIKVAYLHSERFVADMVKALQLNAINDFKRYYRSVDALLIDDIQFFARKERSQEEFFHTFNALLEGRQQMILTCDRFPREIQGLEERLKSRFGWGLTVSIEPPELETRVAILMRKAEEAQVNLPEDAAFFIGQRVQSNVRELEGSLKRVIACSEFMRKPITVELVRDALKDLLALQERRVSIENIQRVVAEYYAVKKSDMVSKRRSRSVARPRQVAMALAKELTTRSLPEIGQAFGGRDHTTVLHGCRKVAELMKTDAEIAEDYRKLLRLLTV